MNSMGGYLVSDSAPKEARVNAWHVIAERLRHTDLDLVSSSRGRDVHSIHPYPAKFTAALPGVLIDTIAIPKATVVDPFCGSGTTLVEALRRGHAAAGFDANPIALLISRAKTVRLLVHDLLALEDLAARSLPRTPLPPPDGNVRVQSRNGGRVRYWFPNHVFSELHYLRQLGEQHLTADQQLLWNVALSALVVRFSHQDEETRYAWVEKNVGPQDTLRAFGPKLRAVIAASSAIGAEYARMGTTGAAVNHIDYTSTSPWLGDEVFDCAVFSPPYPNTFDYALYHRLRLLLFGFDPAELRRSEIGAHLKYEPDTVTYLSAMRRSLETLYRALKSGGVAALVIGDSVIRGKPYNNAKDLLHLATTVGFKTIATCERAIPAERKSFSRVAERLRSEHVLIFGKPPAPKPSPPRAHLTALSGRNLRERRERSAQHQLPLVLDEADFQSAYELQPIEAALAKRFYTVAAHKPQYHSLLRLGPFFHFLSTRGGAMPDLNPTLQALLDGTGRSVAKCTTYFGHGLHPYIGKFYPQIARQLLLLDIVERDLDPSLGLVLDPFCGSGTTLIESCLVGMAGVGIELNPVAALVSTAKLELLRQGFESVRRRGEDLLVQLHNLAVDTDFHAWSSPERRDYLRSWFPVAQLGEIGSIYQLLLDTYGDPFSQGAPFFALLSSILRQCSLQKPSDLRIRRRAENEVTISPLASFRAKLASFLADLENWQEVSDAVSLACQEAAWKSRVVLDDTLRTLEVSGTALAANVACVITSPPYAAALPYIDTDRLSLAALELDRIHGSQRQLEHEMVGNREISIAERRLTMTQIADGEHRLLGTPTLEAFLDTLVDDLGRAGDDVGFRRRNNPAIAFQYCRSMGRVFASLGAQLAPETSFFMLVGGNVVSSGRRQLFLDTAQIMGEIAATHGWVVKQSFRKELTSAGNTSLAHRRAKGMTEEVILHLTRKK